MVKSAEQIFSETPDAAFNRMRAVDDFRKVFPMEVRDQHHSLLRLSREFVHHPYDPVDPLHPKLGSIVIWNHSDLRQGPEAPMVAIEGESSLNDVIYSVVVARHIGLFTNGINRIWNTNLNLPQITTPDSMMNINNPIWRSIMVMNELTRLMDENRAKNPYQTILDYFKNLKTSVGQAREIVSTERQGRGLGEYVETAIDTLQKGGIVMVFIQGGRRPYLGYPGPNDKALEMLFNRTTRAGLNDFGVLAGGFSLEDVDNYERHNGLNFFKKSIVQFGEVTTKRCAIADAEKQGISIDTWGYNQIRPLVAPGYQYYPGDKRD